MHIHIAFSGAGARGAASVATAAFLYLATATAAFAQSTDTPPSFTLPPEIASQLNQQNQTTNTQSPPAAQQQTQSGAPAQQPQTQPPGTAAPAPSLQPPPSISSSTSTPASSTSTPGLIVGLNVSPSVSAGVTGAVLARIRLEASGTGISISSVPLTITGAQGARGADLTNCRLYGSAPTALNTIVPAIGPGGGATIPLTSALTVNPGTPHTIDLRCTVAQSVPSGASFTLSIAPQSMEARSSTGSAITPSAAANGMPGGATYGTIVVTAPGAGGPGAGTPPQSPPGMPGGVGAGQYPGVPNTGTGGGSLLLLVLAFVALSIGGAYLVYGRYSD